MNNYPCELIEDLIPLYIEEDISSITKEIVEDHLKECESCNVCSEYSNNELNNKIQKKICYRPTLLKSDEKVKSLGQ